MKIILTYFREEGETSGEEVSNGELDKKVIHPRQLKCKKHDVNDANNVSIRDS